MSDFNTCIQFVLSNETYKDDKGNLITIYKDPVTGEYSNYGITQTLLQSIRYQIQDPSKLAMTDVLQIYFSRFWSPYYLGSITSNLVAQKCLDMLANMGTFGGSKCIQAAMNAKGFPCVIDGVVGPHTILVIQQCVNTVGEIDCLQQLALTSESYYKSLRTANAAKNLPTWLARAANIGVRVNYESKNS